MTPAARGQRARAARAARATDAREAAALAQLRRRLLAWWDRGHRSLPWRFPRGQADPYRVWISEVMLQQTQVAAVVPYYHRFVARFPTLEALAAAREEEVLALWSGLGYYARGRRLRAAAREALIRHGGLPASVEALAELPGFGPYTAGAVASIAFGIAAPCVDGNVARVLARLLLVDGAPGERATRHRLWALARALVPADRAGDLNQALMDLGAVVCRPAPRCDGCPVPDLCAARRAGREREVPPPRRRPARVAVAVACAVVERGGRVLLERRPSGGLFGGLWALPGAESAPGADARRALGGALAERFGRSCEVGEELASIHRTLTHRELELTAYRCQVPGEIGGRDLRLASPDEYASLGVATAMRRLLERLELGRGADID